MNIVIVKDALPIAKIREIAKEFYTDMIKGAADVEKEIIALGGEYHIDASELLVKNGSRQNNIWGFNVVFDKPRDSWLEYTALINIKPARGNRGMFIEDEKIRDKIRKIVDSKIA